MRCSTRIRVENIRFIKRNKCLFMQRESQIRPLHQHLASGVDEGDVFDVFFDNSTGWSNSKRWASQWNNATLILFATKPIVLTFLCGILLLTAGR